MDDDLDDDDDRRVRGIVVVDAPDATPEPERPATLVRVVAALLLALAFVAFIVGSAVALNR